MDAREERFEGRRDRAPKALADLARAGDFRPARRRERSARQLALGLGDPLVAEEHIIAFNWATQQDLDDMIALALRVNDFLSGLFLGVGIKLVDFKIEIGRIFEGDFQRLVIADEISPDSCRLWDIETGEKLDKDVFRRDLGNLADAYTEVAKRLGIMPQNGNPPSRR